MAQRPPAATTTLNPDEGPQAAVARARTDLMAGRGAGAGQSEAERCQQERPTLGPLPAPLERELVHLNTTAFRTGFATDVDQTQLRDQQDRLRSLWGTSPPHTSTDPPHRTRRVAVASLLTGAAMALAITRPWRRG